MMGFLMIRCELNWSGCALWLTHIWFKAGDDGFTRRKCDVRGEILSWLKFREIWWNSRNIIEAFFWNVDLLENPWVLMLLETS